MDASPSRSALILGATGLVGRHCLDRILGEPAYERVVVLGRRPLPLDALPPSSRDPAKLEPVVIDFDHLDRDAYRFAVDDVYCCLGTTIRKAGSREAFRRVDLEYPKAAARLAAARGARTFLLVSALGADPSSRVFYNRVKGETEEAIKVLPFRRIVIARPSLLLGGREEFRPGERLAQILLRPLGPLMVGPLARYRPVHARWVAARLVQSALGNGERLEVLESERIRP